MREISLDSPAKINLGLNVINKRDDGYHNLVTVMQEIDLKDRIILKDREEGIVIECDRDNIPRDSSNLVYKSWDLLRNYTKLDRGIHIKIEKNIPAGAGLAGGSSNAAMVLKGLNMLWDLGLTREELKNIGAGIGADVPFCLEGGTKIAKGIGDEFQDINSFGGRYILLVNPRRPISTEKVYSNLVLEDEDANRLDDLISYIDQGEDRMVGKSLYNTLERVVFSTCRELGEIKEEMMKSGALGSLMSGSGSTVFGLFNNLEDFNRAFEYMEEVYPEYLIIKSKTI